MYGNGYGKDRHGVGNRYFRAHTLFGGFGMFRKTHYSFFTLSEYSETLRKRLLYLSEHSETYSNLSKYLSEASDTLRNHFFPQEFIYIVIIKS